MTLDIDIRGIKRFINTMTPMIKKDRSMKALALDGVLRTSLDLNGIIENLFLVYCGF